MTDLHLVSWNRPKMTELVIRTIHRNTNRDSFRLTVLDNASDPETIEMLERMRETDMIDDLITIKTNIGLEAARNLLLRESTNSEYFVCIDNDCLPPPPFEGYDWLERMIWLMERHEEYAAISMRTQVMIGTGNIFEEADEHDDDLVNFPHPGGSFRIMLTDAVHKVGGWDRAAPGRGAEERYICGKLNEAGYKTSFAVKIRCLHLFGNREDTKERWGYKEELKPEDTGHSDIWHPALEQGDIKDEVLLYASIGDTRNYFDNSNNQE